MALDEKDLQAISDLLDCKFEKELRPIREDISELKEDVAGLKQDVAGLKQDVLGLKHDVSGLKEDVSGLKRDVTNLKQDVSSLKTKMACMEKKVDDIDKRLIRVEMNQEQHIIPKIESLFDTFIPTTRVTKLEEEMKVVKEDISTLYKAVRQHGVEIHAITV